MPPRPKYAPGRARGLGTPHATLQGMVTQYTEQMLRITLTELVQKLLPDLQEGTEVEIRIEDPDVGKAWLLGSFGTELSFIWTTRPKVVRLTVPESP